MIGHIPVAPDATPVFIAGAPRSGTTLLSAALNSHPQVLITNELRPFMLFNDVRYRTRVPNELMPRHPLRDQFRDGLHKAQADYVRRFYAETVTKDTLGCPAEAGPSVRRVIKAFGDKNPGYADTHSPDCLIFIAESMPDARFIHIHRDPRACVASYKSIDVYSNELDRCINIWLRHTSSMFGLGKKIGGERVLHIRYEDFVTERGDGMFRDIERHIGVDEAKEPVMFLRRERNNHIPYRSPTTPHDQLGRPAWKHRLTQDEIDKILEACGEYFTPAE